MSSVTTEVKEFVHAALESGWSRDSIRKALLDSG